MLSEYINPWVGHVDRSCPAWRCPGAATGFSGSSPGAAPPVPLHLVRLGRVGLWWLESGRCALTDAAYLLSHPGGVVYGRVGLSKQPLHTFGSHPHKLERPGSNNLPPRSSSLS